MESAPSEDADTPRGRWFSGRRRDLRTAEAVDDDSAPGERDPGDSDAAREELGRPVEASVMPQDEPVPPVSADAPATTVEESTGDGAPENGGASRVPATVRARRRRAGDDREAEVSKQEDLAHILAGLRRAVAEVNGVMVASSDGLTIAHDFPDEDGESVAAMAAATLGLGQRITERTSIGELVETVVRGKGGYFCVYGAGDSAVLVVSGPEEINLGLVRLESRAAAAEVARALG